MKRIDQVFRLAQSWFHQDFLKTVLNSKLEKESFLSYFPTERKQIENLRATLAKTWFYKARSKNLRNLFIPASTVSVTPLIEIIFSLLLEQKITCRIPTNFSLNFYETFRERAPEELKDSFKFITWDSSDQEKTRSLIQEADLITVHGNNQTIREIQKLKTPKQKLIAFGHKFSLMLLDLDLINETDYQLIAQDICSYKQLGCLSPQIIYFVSSANQRTEKFIEKLDLEIESFNQELPPAESLQKESFRQNLSISLPQKTEFITRNILLTEDSDFSCSPGLGLVFLRQLESLEQILEIRDRLENISYLSTIGTNLSDQARLKRLQSSFVAARVCSIGKMQKPGLEWIQSPSLVEG